MTAFVRDDVTRKYCSSFLFVKKKRGNEDYGVLAKAYCIIIIVIIIANVVADVRAHLASSVYMEMAEGSCTPSRSTSSSFH